MTSRPRATVRRIAVAALLAAVALTATRVALAQAESSREGVGAVPRTDAGSFVGTWWYVNRDQKMAIWIREGDDGRPELKLKFVSTATPETFETDWNGVANYYLGGRPGRFEVRLDRRDADTLAGTWDWELQGSRSGRSEHARVTMYRGGDGRALVVRFDDFERVIRRGDDVRRYDKDHVLTFMKGSKRLVLWDELPF